MTKENKKIDSDEKHEEQLKNKQTNKTKLRNCFEHFLCQNQRHGNAILNAETNFSHSVHFYS